MVTFLPAPPIIHRPLLRWLLLVAALSLVCPVSGQQAVGSGVGIRPDSQEFFLLQAFHARYAAKRQALYHLGLLTEQASQGYRVSAVLDGFPAQAAGLRRGDLLIAMDGEPFDPILSLNPRIGDGRSGNVMEKPGGPGPIELSFRRNGQPDSVVLEPVHGNLFDAYRSAMTNSMQQFSNGNKVIGYIRLWTLDRSTDGLQTFRQSLAALDHCDGLIVDVRDSYGFISAEHLDRFFPTRNSYFQMQGDNPDLWQHPQRERLTDDYYGRAMVVIQNRGTRGGMELFSYQLGKLQRVVTLGEPTMGKAGRIVSDRSTNSLRYLPGDDILIDGISLESSGFVPEQSVDYPLSSSPVSDPQFQAAMMTLMQIM
ncbi:MAG: S41 family peptidase [Gammaproteobacteria bacterium]|nr:hypothetical protein [Pseudomonadales bacterium]MCP5349118.1 hypothetical protein [Pseudomonadales bacterium]